MIDYIIDRIKNYSWTLESHLISIVLFGEYPYPSEEDYPDDPA